jgi:hypothetical protein
MNGMELSKAFYTEIGEPMLRERFPELLPFLAVGLTGSGSECYGFDDEISQDHDFEPGFCIFVPGENIVDRKAAFALERAYAALPRQFKGFRRSYSAPVGGARHGVLRTAEFMTEKVGAADGKLSTLQWLSIPDYALAEAVNGEIFADHYGEITAIRERIRKRTEDVRRKKLAGHLLLMAQAGQYNYLRCLAHGETAAAQLAVAEFVKSAMAAAFLLGGAYQPYYKWSFRAMRALPVLPYVPELLEYLLTTNNEPKTLKEKHKVIEDIAADVIRELEAQGLTGADSADLERHAYSVNDRVADPQLRNMHILAGV